MYINEASKFPFDEKELSKRAEKIENQIAKYRLLEKEVEKTLNGDFSTQQHYDLNGDLDSSQG